MKIEHAFGVLKARWPTLYNLPMRIGTDKQLGHKKVMNWTMACIVLHNILHVMKENEDWLGIQESGRGEGDRSRWQEESRDPEGNAEAKHAGIQRRNELKHLVEVQESRERDP